MNKIGYIPIEHYATEKPKVCETPRHKGLNFPAFAVMAIDYEWDGVQQIVVQMVCEECWRHFDMEMGSPNWNLLERNNNDVRSFTR